MKLSAGVLLGLSSARELAYYAEEVKNMHLRNTRAIDCSPYMVNVSTTKLKIQTVYQGWTSIGNERY